MMMMMLLLLLMMVLVLVARWVLWVLVVVVGGGTWSHIYRLKIHPVIVAHRQISIPFKDMWKNTCFFQLCFFCTGISKKNKAIPIQNKCSSKGLWSRSRFTFFGNDNLSYLSVAQITIPYNKSQNSQVKWSYFTNLQKKSWKKQEITTKFSQLCNYTLFQVTLPFFVEIFFFFFGWPSSPPLLSHPCPPIVPTPLLDDEIMLGIGFEALDLRGSHLSVRRPTGRAKGWRRRSKMLWEVG